MESSDRPHLLLGVSGSVAAYRAADLARDFMRAGWEVRVCLTDGARQFVTPLLFESLTGNPVLEDVFAEPVKGRMAHIDWARWADVILVAPASADVIAKLAYGIASDMLTTAVVASEAALFIAPAMNPTMFGSDSNRDAMSRLEARGAGFIEPDSGDVACGENGQGKLASAAAIVERIESWRSYRSLLKGKKVLITSGPTYEPIDSVRFIGNRSSGKMGAALARAALEMGAEVIVVSGPSVVQPPKAAQVLPVETTEQMLRQAMSVIGDADIVIGAAAPSDYRAEHPAAGKLRRGAEPLDIRLVPNPDVIASLAAAAKPGAWKVGFAAEPSPDLTTAKEKLAKKGLDVIAFNDVSRNDIGFSSDSNDLTLLFQDGTSETSGKRSKRQCAEWLFEQLFAKMLPS